VHKYSQKWLNSVKIWDKTENRLSVKLAWWE